MLSIKAALPFNWIIYSQVQRFIPENKVNDTLNNKHLSILGMRNEVSSLHEDPLLNSVRLPFAFTTKPLLKANDWTTAELLHRK